MADVGQANVAGITAHTHDTGIREITNIQNAAFNFLFADALRDFGFKNGLKLWAII